MTFRPKTTVAVVGGAVALASGAYALGSQTGGGSAAAQSGSTTTATTHSTTRRGAAWCGPGRMRGFFGGAELDAVARKLGVSTAALRSALLDARAQLGPPAGARPDADLAKALGVTTAQLDAALAKLHPGRALRDDFAQALAAKLGIDVGKVRSALDSLRAAGPRSGGPIAALAKALGIDPDFYKSAEIHLHVPSGAIPKDGPSAGVTMATALISELTGRPVRGDIAMTGEITLSGRVLPVGGIKEKVLAARRVGIREVILPRQNEKNVNEDLTPELRKDLTVHYVQTVDEVLLLALQPSPAATSTSRKTARRAQAPLQ